MPKRKKRNSKKRIIWWIVCILVILLVAGGGLAYSIYHSFDKNFEKTQVMHSTEKRKKQVSLNHIDPVSILLLGVDERKNDKGRSDTIIVLTANPQSNDMKMVSIPRDTYTAIVGHGTIDKLNHAYAFGGINMAADSVESLLNIPIDYVAEVNMEGFKELVDAVGGITVKNSLSFKQDQYEFPKGTITLDGNAALSYVRMRKQDPEGDFGRQNRQKQVISGILKESASVKTLTNYNAIFNALGKNVQTSLTLSDLNSLQKNYRKSISNIDQITFKKGQGEIIDGIWYYKMNTKELESVSKELRQHLELPNKSN